MFCVLLEKYKKWEDEIKCLDSFRRYAGGLISKGQKIKRFVESIEFLEELEKK